MNNKTVKIINNKVQKMSFFMMALVDRFVLNNLFTKTKNYVFSNLVRFRKKFLGAKHKLNVLKGKFNVLAADMPVSTTLEILHHEEDEFNLEYQRPEDLILA